MRKLARWILSWLGWSCLDIPNRPTRAVVIGYPHTSNWDFPIGLLAIAALGLNARWVGKASLFRGPLGPIMRGLGGIPVNREDPGGFVERMADMLRTRENFMLALAPEGTRRLTPGWKSGFYRIARSAQVPVLVGLIDYAQKRIGLVAQIELRGDPAVDMARIAACYQDCQGLRPGQAAPIQLI